MTASTEARLVALGEASPDEWMALSTSAHWNQTEADWQTMLGLGRGWGWGLRAPGERGPDTLVASTLVLPYETRFAWISMVLVLPKHRGRGHARRLLGLALDDLGSRGLLPLLDATPAGRPVYLKHGFVDAWGFERWRRKANAGALPGDAVAPPRVRPLREADWPAIGALDAPAFGASRLPLLRALARRLPGAAWVMEGERALRGFVFGRDGRTALQLGPLVADDDGAGIALLSAALGALQRSGAANGRDLIVDLRSGREPLAAWLRERGFAPERPFTRMVHGAQEKAPGDARRVCLVAGPELG
ncbi:MAG: GNAT family N-acetyltransferase [Rubrivivax sp.]|nr:GNAT family N-acetyltransferase [Rubrivivax sp.]